MKIKHSVKSMCLLIIQKEAITLMSITELYSNHLKIKCITTVANLTRSTINYIW